MAVWEPVVFEVKEKIGDNAIAWRSQGGQDIYWLLLTRQEYLQKKPAVLVRLLKAILEANDFISRKPEAARSIIAQQSNFPLATWDSYPLRYEMYLDEGLPLFMEDQAHWMIQNGLAKRDRMPNFMDYFSPEALRKVAPQSVHLAKPGQVLTK